MMKRLMLLLSIACLIFTSCRKIIDIKTNNADPQLVIEGNITDKLIAQQIKISKSVSYDSKNIFPAVTGAVVTVSDSRGNNYIFLESEPGLYANKMRGIAGLTYTMKVQLEGKTYTAVSKMPALVKFDSVGVIINSFFGNERKIAATFFKDPLGIENFYHFNLYVNDLLSNTVYVSNDRLTDGNNLRIQLYYEENEDDDEGLKTGDRVAIEMETIDSNIFDYWYALSSQSGNGPNQGTTPSNPTSNITNGALGYFSAHTYQKINIVVP